MAGSRVPGSINLRPIDAGTSVLSFSPAQGPTGSAHGTYGSDVRYLAQADAQTKGAPRAAAPASRRLSGDGISLQFTIDDAPGGSATNDAMLDLLDKYKIKTMFFVIGENVQSRPRDFLKLVQRGHRLGNHTWNHPHLRHLKEAEIQSQLKRTDDLVRKLTGKSMAPHWRPPYGEGAYDSRVLKAAADIGFTKMWYWDVDSEDWKILKGPPKHQVVRPQAEITKLITDNIEHQVAALAVKAKPGREGEKGKYVVLVHDKPTTVAALEVLLPRLKSEGYSFVDFP
jgi:peptidoglycan/xylan/chitin deacetylase (PgdA/CDA1 family)